nr:RNA-directed DNA polymerase, eukaryota, reverse transcriptase zinc-binding domain protein [Tanacetum cinerariifolium]
MEIIKDIQEAEKVDNLEATQKAKIKWAIEGDENTKFYHEILNKKRNQLGIRGVLKDGDISYQEIKRAVWDCGIDKSPGPDGVTFGFIRRYWSLIEKDVVAAVQHFFTFDLVSEVQSAFVADREILDGPLILNE